MIDDLYGLAFPLAVPFWALMILAPTWSLTVASGERAVLAYTVEHADE